ncbi:MAG: hypothetical protein M4579_005775 [Chaenotheca gracillima]|nr:MAG: hypothetical protein M4579_005775 [Chaenotheca gracillima]
MSEQRQQDVDMPDPADDFPRLDREIYGQEFERDIAFVGRGADPEPSMDIATLAKYYREMSDFLYAKDSLGRARSPSGLDQVYTQGLPHHLSQAGPNPSAPGFVSSLPLRDHRPDAVDPALLRNPSPCPFPPAMLGENSYGPATHSQMVPLSNGLYFEDPARASSCACGNTIAPQGTSKSAYRNPSGLAGPSTQPENNWLRENSFGCGTMAEHHAAELESLPRPIPALSSQRIPHPFFFQMRAGPQESPHERPLAFEPFHGTQKAPSQPLPLTTHPGSQQHMDSREVSPKEHWSDRSYPLYGQKDAASHNLRTSQPMVGLDSNSALVSPSTGDVRHPGTVQLKNSRNNSSRKRLSDLSNPISIGQDGRRRTKHASRPSQVFNSSQLSRSDSRNASSFISPLGYVHVAPSLVILPPPSMLILVIGNGRLRAQLYRTYPTKGLSSMKLFTQLYAN